VRDREVEKDRRGDGGWGARVRKRKNNNRKRLKNNILKK
jgi:hypothetical protein